MTIILFLLDTSSSMCQKAFVNGVQKTYLDIAKGAVETFLKFRQRTQDCLGDRYMLLTFEEPPANIKAGWKENHATFMNELKNLQSTGLTTMGESLKNAFDLLNLNRMQSGIDTYGQGRCPFYLEPSVIIVITDGGRYSYRNGVHPEIILPLSTQIPGTKFTKEPFRWDQRLFSLVLRMSGNRIEDRIEGKVPHAHSPNKRMCEVTGGRSYRVRSHFVLNQCLESLVQKVQPGVVLQFEPMLPKEGAMPNGVEPNSDIVFQPTKKMIYVQKHISQKTFPIGYWPLPEPYWPDPKALTLHPRDAHPKLKVVTTAVDEPQMVRSFPVDKYDIEAGPLTFQILQKREINKCWQVIISNGMHGFELPFGYLKATPNFTQVHLYVLAYNYPALLPLLNDLIHKYNMSPPNDLMYKFNAYVRSIPPYYCPFLRKALHNINVPYPLLQFLLPENVDNYLSPNIANQLKIIKNTAKQDQENLCLKVFKQLKQPKPPYRQVETAKLNTGVPLRRDLVRHPLLRDTFAKLHAELEPIENFTVVVPQMTRQASAKSYRNPFDIPRRDLIEEIARMRETFLRPTPTSLVAKDSGHCLPIAEMGNYQEYLKNKDNPLREIEPTNVRQHMFGNPYKKDKHMVMVDEADLGEMAPIKASGSAGTNGMSNQNMSGMKKLDARVRKRKAGPIRKDFVFRRNSIDQSRSSSPACSTSSGMLSPICASPAPSNSSYDMSDYDDDSMSDCSSTISTDDAESGRLVMSFDFNEEENTESDFPLNGYVRNFINGINEEASVNCTHADATATSNNNGTTGNLMLHMSANLSNVNAAPAANSHILLTMNSNGNLTVPVVPTTQPNTTTQHPYMNNYVAASARTTSTILSNMPAVQTEALPAYAQVGVGVAVNGLFYAAPGATQTTALPATNVQHLNGGNMYGIPAVGLPTNVVNNTIMPQLAMYNQAQQQQQPLVQMQAIPQPILQQPQTQLQQPTTQQQSQQATTILAATTAATATIQTMPMPQVHTAAAHLGVMAQQQQQQPQQQQQQSATAVAATALHIQHTDINDAQAISRILQQCHNGNINSSNNTTHNSSSNNITYSHNLHDITSATTAAHTHDIMMADVELMPPPFHQHNVQNNYDHAKVFTAADQHLNHHAMTNNGIGNAMNYQQTNNKTTNVNNQQQQQRRTKAATVTKTVKVEPLTEEQREVARKHNMEIRTLIFRDIRRPGRNYTQLLDHLNLVKGDFEMQSHFVDMCINESQRFRRRQMVHTIEGWWQLKKKLHKSVQQQQQQPHILTATS